MTLTIALVVCLVSLYSIGVIVGSHIEKQRWKEKKSGLNQKKDRHEYGEHQQLFNAQGDLIWETESLSSQPNRQHVDLFA